MKRIFTVRPANIADLEKVSKLFGDVVTSLEYYSVLAKETELKKNTPSRLLEKLVNDPLSVLIAVDRDEKVVGFAFSHFNDYTVYLD